MRSASAMTPLAPMSAVSWATTSAAETVMEKPVFGILSAAGELAPLGTLCHNRHNDSSKGYARQWPLD